jgi:hypothetical protein
MERNLSRATGDRSEPSSYGYRTQFNSLHRTIRSPLACEVWRRLPHAQLSSAPFLGANLDLEATGRTDTRRAECPLPRSLIWHPRPSRVECELPVFIRRQAFRERFTIARVQASLWLLRQFLRLLARGPLASHCQHMQVIGITQACTDILVNHAAMPNPKGDTCQ